MSPAVRRSRPLAAVIRWRSGCSPVSVASASSWTRRVGHETGGESRDVPVGLVAFCDGLGSDESLGCDVEAVGVALDRLE